MRRSSTEKRMPLKDALAILISSLALIVSIATFVVARIDRNIEEQTEKDKAVYAAYYLGKYFSKAFMIYTQVTEGSPDEVVAWQERSFSVARDAQLYADRLDLRVDLRPLIVEYKPDKSLGFRPEPFKLIENSILQMHDSAVLDAFHLSYWLMWLYVESKIYEEHHPDKLNLFVDYYPEIANSINKSLSSIGIERSISSNWTSSENVRTEIASIFELIEHQLRVR